MSKLVVTAYVLPDGPVFTATGRDAWALLELIRMGERGLHANRQSRSTVVRLHLQSEA